LLLFSVPPVVTVPSETVYIVSGGNKTVPCSATGDPSPNLEWSRNPRLENYRVTTRDSKKFLNLERYV